MKWVSYLLVIALIIAIITSPSIEKFKKFANNTVGDSSVCKPLVDYNSYKVVISVFGIGHIKKCTGTSGIYNPQTGKPMPGIALPVYGESETYLGLFGTFWKL
jgi:hypothetical protein